MKKTIALSLIAVSLAASSAFGQGYFLFTSGKSQAYDGFTTPGAAATAATVDVAFLWAAASTTPDVSALLASTPKLGNSTTAEAYTVAQAWGFINDGQFTLAVDNGTGNPAIVKTVANGSITYNAGADFGVTGTAPGSTYTVYEISWNAAYANPTAAAAAGSAVGWSAPIQYTAVSSIGTPATFAGIAGFGTFAPPGAVPEPGTMALAGLGGLSMLAFRRRK